MSKLKLTQTDLLEVLVQEIESLKKSKSQYLEVFKEGKEYIQEIKSLCSQPIPIDMAPLREEHLRIQETLRKGMYVPKWLWQIFAFFFLLFFLSLGLNAYQHRSDLRKSDYISWLEEKVESLSTKRRRK